MKLLCVQNLLVFLAFFLLLSTKLVASQPVYFIDGQHGGIYGHYPLYVTQYLVDQLNQHPNWKINLEIEPETWDVVQTNTPEAYEAFKKLFDDQSENGRIEYVNPQYGQSYLWDVTGESVIRQFDYGISKIRQHFPDVVFTTYSSEEPMFTSALPGILRSFGFKYAVLKNPDTCWGGYTRAFGGELVNWMGPDGTKIVTVPRYAVESLQPGSTWQTIAWDDSPGYINAALSAGIKHPIGMCFQDAGWTNGPWLGEGTASRPVLYETWRHYFEKVAVDRPNQDWAFSQEDVLVSLVWGSQVLQQVAREVRDAENKILSAEKLATLAKIYASTPWPRSSLDEAWRNLLLSEHHDCWIVPYNLKNGSTWASHVADWTTSAKELSGQVTQKSIESLSPASDNGGRTYVRVFNTLGVERTSLASTALPEGWLPTNVKIVDMRGRGIPSQIVSQPSSNSKEIIFPADVPAMGYSTYHLENNSPVSANGASVSVQADGTYRIETDFYELKINPAKGGTIQSLTAKSLKHKEFVDISNPRRFDEMRGFFYDDGGFHSSADHPAQVSILENGPVRVRVAINGTIDSYPFVKIITLVQGQRAIDFALRIDWTGHPGIGASHRQSMPWQEKDNTKAFYDDRYKLLALFPLNFNSQMIYKNAPFDVAESWLTNTFFTSWDGIKNNVILNWVDVLDASSDYGLALFTDRTTSYEHGADYPLGLTLQYAGTGLWGRNYRITGPTEVHYALVPHVGKWDHANIWTESDAWNQPFVTSMMKGVEFPDDYSKSLLDATATGLEISAAYFKGSDLIVRVFNAEGVAGVHKISFKCKAAKVQLVELDGRVIEDLPVHRDESGENSIELTLPKFGIRTVKFCNAGI
jgi:alpha-mannosidase